MRRHGMTPDTADNTTCRTHFIHQGTVQQVRASTPREETLYELTDFFKVLGDTTRIRILHALFISEMCVCDLAEVLGAGQSAVSHQLKVLRQAGLVRFRREGRMAFYSLKDEHVKHIMEQALQHTMESQ
jgi:ArsR family transcriptional regulator